MAWYRWKGIDSTDRLIHGTLWALSHQDLFTKLSEQNIGLLQAQTSWRKKRISHAEKDAFFDHLATLLRAHVPLYQAVDACAALSKSSLFKQTIESITQSISQGQTFSKIVQEHELSDALCNSLLLIGESTGVLSEVLRQYVEYRKYLKKAQTEVIQALLGPLIIMILFLFILCAVLIGVIPLFRGYFEAFKIPVSSSTALLFLMSDTMTMRTIVLFGSSCFIACGALKIIGWTKSGQYLKETLLEKLPVIGSIHTMLYRGRTLRTLGMLLEQGIPLSNALQICSLVLPHTNYQQAVITIKELIENGASLESALSDSLFADFQISTFIKLGETTGDLAPMLLSAAELQEKRLNYRLNLVTKLIHPFLLIILAGFIGMLAYSLYMPLLDLSHRVNF